MIFRLRYNLVMPLSADFLHELKKRFKGDLRFDPASRALYSTDASIYQIEPLGVAIPQTQEDLHAVVELAAKYKIPILPRGAGTSLAGQAIGNALILDCSRWLDRIVEINSEERYAIVEPGVVLSNLNRAAARYGLQYGPDPASAERATMGGVLANNATGAHSILYGMSADHLLEAEVILSDGSLMTWREYSNAEAELLASSSVNRIEKSIISAALEIRRNYASAIKQNFPLSWRNSAGYRLNYLLPYSPGKPPRWQGDYPALQPSSLNLHPLLAGSEGTLAILRRIKINLVPKPKHTILCVLTYESVAAACDDIPRLLEYQPDAIELIPQLILRNARSIPAYARQMGWLTGDPSAVLVVEFSGDSPPALKEATLRLRSAQNQNPVIAESPEEQTRIWNVRKVGLGILDSRPQSARPIAFIEDCAIPIERLGEFVREVEKILSTHGTYGGMYAHASAGCLHIRPVLDLWRGEGVRAMRSIAEQVLAVTLRLGGSMSSEHGDGLARGEFIARIYGSEVTEAMRLLKRAADPHNILNPNKLFDAPPMDTHLRYDETYRLQPWQPALHFDHERGLAGAIEQCNGQGVCRKTSGVMCPSFQATREEAYSTRGRANLLRALLASHAVRASLVASRHVELREATFRALDLCLACKGCTAECPSGVDMPKLKYEFMNEYYKSHRRKLRDYLFGYFHVVAKWLSLITPLANYFMQMNGSRKMIARALGITDQRPFPVFASERFKPNPQPARAKTVIFLPDVFSRYIEPQVEKAACEVLNWLGYDVKMLTRIGSGASLLSKGFVEAARKHAANVLDEIQALDGGAGLSVVGCEPPEVYCLKHEYSALLPERRAEIESLAQRVWLVDELILRVASMEDKFHLPQKTNSKPKVIFHPHCHQRAEGTATDGLPSGVSATVEMLRLFGFDVQVIEAGCCGMAGTFGYDVEHYELSMKVGELGVLPAMRKLKQDHLLLSSGAACRLQIRHGTGIEAKPPIVLIGELLSAVNHQG
ncbi:MAG TPA: FAD-linked oxidase C-terminal domain-containing protein [Anaerolineales bacterium]|nr:FAD-linked oxidase C-terminal domain-containing protein [Anaerolineales bacterium]